MVSIKLSLCKPRWILQMTLRYLIHFGLSSLAMFVFTEQVNTKLTALRSAFFESDDTTINTDLIEVPDGMTVDKVLWIRLLHGHLAT
jgi:hypothetical protein